MERSFLVLLPWWLLATWFFASGFLLTRTELETVALAAPLHEGKPRAVPLRYKRVVLVIIDALRHDVARDHLLPVSPRLGLCRFRSDAPTTTSQRLKALTTGSLPTFIDISRNFASDEIGADNWLDQAKRNGRERLVVLGDDTWGRLFPGRFSGEHLFPSFNVRDLHTVDDGVLSQVFSVIDNRKYDVLIAHFLGLDHAGHTYGPDTDEFRQKLSQMSAFLSRLLPRIDNETLLIVFGDHGMTATGNHGGASEDELNAAILFYDGLQHPNVSNDCEIPQIDLVPTVSALLGVPIPFGNLGKLIAQLFSTHVYDQLLIENVAQVRNYIATYAISHPNVFPSSELRSLASLSGAEYLVAAADMCRRVWATFDVFKMSVGVAGMAVVLLLWICDINVSATPLLLGSAIGPLASVALLGSFTDVDQSTLFLAGLLMGPLLLNSLLISLWSLGRPNIWWLLVALHGVSLFSNSFIEAESSVNLFLLKSALILLLLSPEFRRKDIAALLLLSACIPAVSPVFSVPVGALVLFGFFFMKGASSPHRKIETALLMGILIYFATKTYQGEIFNSLWLVRIGLPRLIGIGIILLAFAGRNFESALGLFLLLVSGPKNVLCSAVFLGQNYLANRHLSAFSPMFVFFARQFFYATGKTASFASLDFEIGFLGADTAPHAVAGVLIVLNALAPILLAHRNSRTSRAISVLFCLDALLTSCFVFGARRHLMVWRVFAPKYVFDAAFMLASIASFCVAMIGEKL